MLFAISIGKNMKHVGKMKWKGDKVEEHMDKHFYLCQRIRIFKKWCLEEEEAKGLLSERDLL